MGVGGLYALLGGVSRVEQSRGGSSNCGHGSYLIVIQDRVKGKGRDAAATPVCY